MPTDGRYRDDMEAIHGSHTWMQSSINGRFLQFQIGRRASRATWLGVRGWAHLDLHKEGLLGLLLVPACGGLSSSWSPATSIHRTCPPSPISPPPRPRVNQAATCSRPTKHPISGRLLQPHTSHISASCPVNSHTHTLPSVPCRFVLGTLQGILSLPTLPRN